MGRRFDPGSDRAHGSSNLASLKAVDAGGSQVPLWRRRWASILARVVVTVALITSLFLILPASEILSAIRRVQPRMVIAVLLGFVAGHVLAAFKWRVLLSASGLATPAAQAVRAHGAGLFANLCLPSLVGGDLLKTILVSRSSGRVEVALVGTMADRVLDTLALILIVSGAAAFLPGSLTDTTTRVLAVVIAAMLLAGALGALALVLRPRWLPPRLRERIDAARGAVLALSRRPLQASIALALALTIQAAFIGLNVGIGRSVGLALPVAAWFLLWPLAKLTALAPISLGGIGVREVAFAALVTRFGADPTLAVAQSLLWEAVLIAGGLSGGLFWLLSARRPSLRADAEQPL